MTFANLRDHEQKLSSESHDTGLRVYFWVTILNLIDIMILEHAHFPPRHCSDIYTILKQLTHNFNLTCYHFPEV